MGAVTLLSLPLMGWLRILNITFTVIVFVPSSYPRTFPSFALHLVPQCWGAGIQKELALGASSLLSPVKGGKMYVVLPSGVRTAGAAS
jgi:hypothetical protein